MHFIVLGIAVLLVALLFFFAGPQKSGHAETGSTKSAPASVMAPTQKTSPKPLTRQELDQKLFKLRQSSPKIQNQRGALCYKPRAEPTTMDYICPKDGQRTQYPRHQVGGGSAYLAAHDIASMREIMRSIGKPNLSLDESELCRKCKPKVKDPRAVLVVKIPGMPEHRFPGVTHSDLVLVREFLAGKEVHKEFNHATTPLKEDIPRIKMLLGLDADKPAK